MVDQGDGAGGVEDEDRVAVGQLEFAVHAVEVGMADGGAHRAQVFAGGIENLPGDRGDPLPVAGAACRVADLEAVGKALGQGRAW